MKCLFVISFCLLLFFVNTVESSVDTFRGCINYSPSILECYDFQHTYLPYTKDYRSVLSLDVYGDFEDFTVDTGYLKMQYIRIVSPNFRKVELGKYVNFKKLKGLIVENSERVLKLDFTGAYELSVGISLIGNKAVNYSCESLKLSALRTLDLKDNNLESFDLSCVPYTVRGLRLSRNKISTLNLPLHSNNTTSPIGTNSTTTNSYCSVLKSLHSLVNINLCRNLLQEFRFECLPSKIKYVFLTNNRITEVPDLSKIPHSLQRRPVKVFLRRNPIRCTCSLLRDYVQLVETNNVIFDLGETEESDYGQAINCANVDSQLANYPWNNNAAVIKLHDDSALGCLDGGEDIVKDNGGKNATSDSDDNTENGNNEHKNSIDNDNYGNATYNGKNKKEQFIDNDNYDNTTSIGNNKKDKIIDNYGNNTGIDNNKRYKIIDYYDNKTDIGNNNTDRRTTGTITNKNKFTNTSDNDNGNSSTVNFIDKSLIFISYFIQFYFMLF